MRVDNSFSIFLAFVLFIFTSFVFFFFITIARGLSRQEDQEHKKLRGKKR